MPPSIAVTLGEPAGIGPDITLKVWRDRKAHRLRPFYLIGDPDFLARRARRLDLDVPIEVVEPADAGDAFASHLPVVPLDLPVTADPGVPDASSAPAAIAAIERAVADVIAGHASA